MDKEILNQIAFKFETISMIVFLVTLFFLRIYLRKKSLSEFKKQLQLNETIIYEPDCDRMINLWFPLSIAIFGCYFILPFFLYSNTQQIGSTALFVSRGNLYFWILCELVCVFAILIFVSVRYIVTNHRVAYITAFAFLNKFIKLDLSYSNIKNLELKGNKTVSFEVLYLWLKDGKQYSLIGLSDLKRIKEIVENYI